MSNAPASAKPKRPAGLKPATKGEVRNPGGNNGSSWLPELRKFFLEQIPESYKRSGGKRTALMVTRLHRVFAATYESAISGETASQKLIIELMCGKPKEQVELSGPDGAPLVAPRIVLYLPDNGTGVGASRSDDDDDDEVTAPLGPPAASPSSPE